MEQVIVKSAYLNGALIEHGKSVNRVVVEKPPEGGREGLVKFNESRGTRTVNRSNFVPAELRNLVCILSGNKLVNQCLIVISIKASVPSKEVADSHNNTSSTSVSVPHFNKCVMNKMYL